MHLSASGFPSRQPTKLPCRLYASFRSLQHRIFHFTNTPWRAKGLRLPPATTQNSLHSTRSYFQLIKSHPSFRQFSTREAGQAFRLLEFLFPLQQLTSYNKILYHIYPYRCHTFPKLHLTVKQSSLQETKELGNRGRAEAGGRQPLVPAASRPPRPRKETGPKQGQT